jgi:hypothetical protein
MYVIALSVYPCSDGNTCADEIKNGQQSIGVSDHEHSDSEEDLCSPFCICSCCAAHIKLSPISDLNFPTVVHNTKEIIPYLEKQIVFDHNHIWQPPRI